MGAARSGPGHDARCSSLAAAAPASSRSNVHEPVDVTQVRCAGPTALRATARPHSRIARSHMLNAPSPSRRLAPEWATRLLLAFIVLSLAALIAIPWWASTRHLQPLQHEMNQIADPVRGLMTRIHLSLAQEGNALDDFIDERDALLARPLPRGGRYQASRVPTADASRRARSDRRRNSGWPNCSHSTSGGHSR